MPMGISNGPIDFQLFIDDLLDQALNKEERAFVSAMMDDIVVNHNEYDECLRIYMKVAHVLRLNDCQINYIKSIKPTDLPMPLMG